MAHGKSSSSSSELLQIVILTLAMTSGGFCLLYLGLKVFMIPRVAQKVETEARDYEKLAALLSSQELIELRANAKEQAETDQQDSLPVIIDREVAAKNLDVLSRVPGPPRISGNIIEEKHTRKLGAAPMRDVLEFVARVRNSKKSVRVEAFDMQRARTGRGGDEVEDSWTSSIDFVEFKPRS